MCVRDKEHDDDSNADDVGAVYNDDLHDNDERYKCEMLRYAMKSNVLYSAYLMRQLE